MKFKYDIDRAVALAVGMPVRDIKKITAAFLDEVSNALATDGEVELRRFAKLVVTVGRGMPARQRGKIIRVDKIHVRLRKKFSLTKLLKKAMAQMDKYGVDESSEIPDFEKKAGKEAVCPKCGAKVEAHGRTIICPKCGSEPWEKDAAE